MPIGQVIGEQNTYNADTSAGVSYSFAAIPAVGSHLIVPVLSAFAGVTWSYSDSQGNTPVQDQGELVGGDFISIQIFRVPVQTTGASYTITLVPNVTNAFADICAIEVQGLIAKPFDRAVRRLSSNPSDITISSPALTQSEEFIVAAYVSDGVLAPSPLVGPGSPWTTLFLETNGAVWPVGGVVYRFVGSTSPVKASWSGSDGLSGCAMMSTYKMKQPPTPSPSSHPGPSPSSRPSPHPPSSSRSPSSRPRAAQVWPYLDVDSESDFPPN